MEPMDYVMRPISQSSLFNPFDTENPDSPSPVLDDECIEKLLELEADLMDLDSVQETEFDDAILDHEIQKNEEILQEDSFHLVEIAAGEDLNEERCLTDLLFMGAEAVEARNWLLSLAITAKLKALLFDQETPKVAPFERLALIFSQGLHFKALNSLETTVKDDSHSVFDHSVFDHPVPKQSSNALPLLAFQVVQELSPYIKFAHFTANQAILEATEGRGAIHVVDFDIMEGIQWAPLMVDLAIRSHASLRITAISFDQQDRKLVFQTGIRLKEFAESIGFPLVFDQIVMVEEEDFERKINLEENQTLVANCMIHQLQRIKSRGFSLVQTFLNGMSTLPTKLLVLVEEQLFSFPKFPSMSFVDFFFEALHHYSALSDSFWSSLHGGYNKGFSLIEEEFLGSRILDCLVKFPSEEEKRLMFRGNVDAFRRFRAVPLSSCNVSQAKFLVSLFNGGYWVQKEKSRLALCWKSRPLMTVSVWAPKTLRLSSSLKFPPSLHQIRDK